MRVAVGVLTLCAFSSNTLAYSPSSSPRGCAATPLDKKKIAVLGAGGYSGCLVFGFLQRCASLYGTGVGNVRAIGSTAETSLRLNRVLSKNFCLAMADESFVKLTDLTSVEAVTNRLRGWDALVLGGDLGLCRRPVTGNTYEKTPNDKTWEIYWGTPSNIISGLTTEEESSIRRQILETVLRGASEAGVRHVVAVDDGVESILPLLQNSNIPFTRLKPTGSVITVPDYTYRSGVQGRLVLSNGAAKPNTNQISVEDVAALCVQSLQSVDWDESRSIVASCIGPVEDRSSSGKRPDQQWCANSVLLEAALGSL